MNFYVAAAAAAALQQLFRFGTAAADKSAAESFLLKGVAGLRASGVGGGGATAKV